MAGLIGILRSGDWLTHERLWVWPLLALGGSLVGLLFILLTSDGLNDYQGRPIGSDFSNVYAAGTYVREGHPSAPFDWTAQFQREKTLFGEKTQFYGWHYPPFFLFVAGALATMPYQPALLVWQLITFLLYLMSIRAIAASSSVPQAGRLWLLLASAYPAVFVNLTHGHNGFLSAALIGGALLLLDRRPIAAGILLGLMAYKPQFGFMLPLALIAGGRWRAFASATVTVIALVALTTLVFGIDVWRAFFDTLHLSRTIVIEGGDTGWHKIQSVFSWVRSWGGGVKLAYTVQGAVTLTVAGVIVWLWRSEAAYPLKAAALALGSILATPYSLDYDLMVLAPAIGFLAVHGISRGFGSWEISTLVLLWFMPLFARPLAEYALIPIGVWTMLVVFGLVARRAARDLKASMHQQAL